MRSSILVTWNVVLTIALAALLFMQFKKSPAPVETGAAKDSIPQKPASSLPIAVINIDSLQGNYSLFVNKKKELEQKQNQIEATLEAKTRELQKEYTDAQQSAPTMTQQQLAETEQRLQKKQADIQQLQSQLTGDFQNQLDKFNKELQDSLDSFLKVYNASKKYEIIFSHAEGGQLLYTAPYFDITADAIKGMNERLKK